jgi:hypothetical protein
MEYGFDFTFQREPGWITRVAGEGFKSPFQRDLAFLNSLAGSGYKLPRFWQYWRWGEGVPSVMQRAPRIG